MLKDRIKYIHLAGMNIPEIAKKLNISISVVRSTIIDNGATQKKEIRGALNELDVRRHEDCVKRVRN